MKKKHFEELRQSCRKLVRELGTLNINDGKKDAAYWHALIEINRSKNITISELGDLLHLSQSKIFRVAKILQNEGSIDVEKGLDKREKYLKITPLGISNIQKIDDYSAQKIAGALDYLEEDDLLLIQKSIEKYADALFKHRQKINNIKILKLSTSRPLRREIVTMIECIQKGEFSIPITPDINECIFKAEGTFYFNNSYNFWYAKDDKDQIIGTIGLCLIDKNSAEVKKFFITKEYRGKGLSHSLMDTLIENAIKHDFKTLYLGTVDKLKAAQRFYQKYGFVQIEKNELPADFKICALDTHFFKKDL